MNDMIAQTAEHTRPHHRPMDGIPLHRIAVIRPFTRFLTKVGASVERGFSRARLPVCALEDVDNYVPSRGFWAFLIDMARREHMEDLGFRVGMRFGANGPDPRISELLRASPTLYRGVARACEMTNKTITNCTMGMMPSRRDGYTYVFHSPSCGADNPAVEQIGWFGLGILIGMIREYAGAEWQPTEIGLMTHRAPNRHIRNTLPVPRVRQSQPASYIELPNSMLSLPPPGPDTRAAGERAIGYEKCPVGFVGTMRTLVATYVQESEFSIKDAAALCDTSVRTLQRNLKQCGTSYSEVLDEARFQIARRLLREPQVRIAEISYRLGYANPTHFSRAFRRIAGVSPKSYRQAQTCASQAH